eukprot:3202109-Pleurochrysis_carterae.AAC.1
MGTRLGKKPTTDEKRKSLTKRRRKENVKGTNSSCGIDTYTTRNGSREARGKPVGSGDGGILNRTAY